MAKFYPCSSIASGVGSLTNLDGATLNDGDVAFVGGDGDGAFYELDADSGFDELSPIVMAPLVNPSTKRWILKQKKYEVADIIDDVVEDVTPLLEASLPALLLPDLITDVSDGLGVTDYTETLLAAATAEAAREILEVTGGLVYKGGIDCSANPNYPAADAGHLYKCTVAGKIGGASGTDVVAGADMICKVDDTAEGTQAAVGANWDVIMADLGGAVIGPAGATDEALAMYDGVTGLLLKDGPSLGTAANNVVQLTAAAKLPAVDGSLLTGVVATLGAEELTGEMMAPVTGRTLSGMAIIDTREYITLGSAPTERSTGSDSYVKLKELGPIQRSGTVTVSFDAASNVYYGANYGRVRIYVNDVAVTAELAPSEHAVFTNYAYNLVVAYGDVISVYGKHTLTGTTYKAFVKNLLVTAIDPYVAREVT